MCLRCVADPGRIARLIVPRLDFVGESVDPQAGLVLHTRDPITGFCSPGYLFGRHKLRSSGAIILLASVSSCWHRILRCYVPGEENAGKQPSGHIAFPASLQTIIQTKSQ